jgi:transposase
MARAKHVPATPALMLDQSTEGAMQYLGIDVHSETSLWCLLGETGSVQTEGKTATTAASLQALAARLGSGGPIRAAQEVGTMAYLVHDAFTAAGVEILSFNAAQLRMIAASRKKTDRRDAFWIAKALATGMHPHPVYIPTGEIRDLRMLLTRRRSILVDRNRWQLRARSVLRACGQSASSRQISTALAPVLAGANGAGEATKMWDLCQRQHAALTMELRAVDREIRCRAQSIEAIERLQTIPGIGALTATTIYAWIGDVRRFPTAKTLGAYAGLVPQVRQSGAVQRLGPITKTGSKPLRATLVQAANTVIYRCASHDAQPLKAIAERVKGSRGRRKIAVVALARHLLRIAYYVLRDETIYERERIGQTTTLRRAVA